MNTPPIPREEDPWEQFVDANGHTAFRHRQTGRIVYPDEPDVHPDDIALAERALDELGRKRSYARVGPPLRFGSARLAPRPPRLQTSGPEQVHLPSVPATAKPPK